MSFEIFLGIYCVAPDELPKSFTRAESLKEFTTKHEARLIVGSIKGDIYYVLEKSVSSFGLSALEYFDFSKSAESVSDKEMGEILIKQPSAQALRDICTDMDSLVARAASNPSCLIFEAWGHPDLQTEEEKYISESASSVALNTTTTDLAFYDEGEMWDHFFYFLDVFRAICRENVEDNKAMLLLQSYS